MAEFVLPRGSVSCSAEPGRSLTEIAEGAGVLLCTRCGGQGTCGGCAVQLTQGSFLSDGEPVRLDGTGSLVSVLACQTMALSDDVVVRVPARSLIVLDEPVLEDASMSRATVHDPSTRRIACSLPSRPLVAETSDTDRERLWGLAVDLGTTTVTVGLVDLESGELSLTASAPNRQIRYGDDIVTRIARSSEPHATEELQRLLVAETVHPLIRLLCERREIDPARLVRMACAGNTTMQLLACGISPASLGTAPFDVPVQTLSTLAARDLGLPMNLDGPVDLLPSASGYVGGDLVGDLYTSGMTDRDARSLLIDLGTNAEVALGSRSGLWVCAAPAGPAWEGGKIARGVRASRGAIEHLAVDAATGDVTLRILGHAPPVGLCGSALVDLLAEGVRVGLLTPTGRFSDAWLGACPRIQTTTHPRVSKHFVVARSDQTADGIAITVSEVEIAELLKAKAAVSAAVGTLLGVAGWSRDDIDVVYLAGDFSRHIDVGNAMAIGLLPSVPADRVTLLGNGSLAGAVSALVDASALPRMREIARAARVVELNQVASFEREFVDGLILPGPNGF